MSKSVKVLFVYKSLNPFIKDDLEILQKHFNVLPLQWKGYLNLAGFIPLVCAVKKCDVIFLWFENYRAAIIGAIAKMFGKKTVLVAAGAVTLGLEWSSQKKFVKGSSLPGLYFFAKLSVRLADAVLAVSEYKKKGLLSHINIPNVKVVPNCFDYEKYCPKGKKENVVLTVCFIDKYNIVRKGIDVFIQAAKFFPDTSFIVLGENMDGTADQLRKNLSPNVKIITEFEKEEIISCMQKASVYTQLSSMESFGAALAEAMLCGCVPVTTGRGFMAELVGDAGFYCEYGDVESTVMVIRQALKSDKGPDARERVKKLFPSEKREKGLVDTVNTLL